MRPGERQVAPDISGIRRDHVARYAWACDVIAKKCRNGRVLDVACGVGYGAKLLAERGFQVRAIDADAEAIEYARANYAHEKIAYQVADAQELPQFSPPYDAAVCFETIEHLKNPAALLNSLRAANLLLASVPNETYFPYRGYAFHERHYTREQFIDLLASAGFEVVKVLGQVGPQSKVGRRAGRTLVVIAERRSSPVKASPAPRAKPKGAVPHSVAILGLGRSLATYINGAKGLGARGKIADEIWGINALGDVLKCDRVFHQDDVRIQEIRAAADPNGNIAAMLTWLKTHPGPIYTSQPHPDYPGMVAYPLAAVLNSCAGQRYMNSTAACAIAFAIHLGVKKIMCFGIDFTLPNAHHAEQGRACVEFWLGFARARGIEIACAKDSSLLDACEPADRRIYGYDAVDMKIDGAPGHERVRMKARKALPTAEEMERRYDHSRHPNPLMRD